jgi:hypothetical protein
MTDLAADRAAILRNTVAYIDGLPGARSDAALWRAREFAQGRLERELDADRRYGGLARTLSSEAATYAARADVRGVERVIARVDRLDEQLGRRRLITSARCLRRFTRSSTRRGACGWRATAGACASRRIARTRRS